MKYFMLPKLLLILILTQGLAQEVMPDACERTGNKATEDIKKMYPFDQARYIRVVSFKTSEKVVDEWEIPKVNGKVDVSRLFEIKTLNKKQTTRLLDILVNINYVSLPSPDSVIDSVAVDRREIRLATCYLPRHAILFVNDLGQVFAYVEICLECNRYKAYPDTLFVGEFCFEKYTMLENFFRDVGIRHGIESYGH